MLGLGSKISNLFYWAVNELAAINNYFRPDGTSTYKRPSGGNYIRP